MFVSIVASTKACSLVKNEQSSASSSWRILPRIRVRAICASTFGLRSPAMIAVSMSRPETPWMSVITDDSFRWASSSSFSHRAISAVRAWVRCRRHRALVRQPGGSPPAARSWRAASPAR